MSNLIDALTTLTVGVVSNAVQDISFNESAFDSLVLPSNKKELIHGFIATHQSNMTQFDDVIQGKGRGIILLLCGPPGVGKTLTAESVAEEMVSFGNRSDHAVILMLTPVLRAESTTLPDVRRRSWLRF